ncbi:MAG: response regulator [Chloroflexi bacterium]|nr:response regulator [Chloroflexota bacterium]
MPKILVVDDSSTVRVLIRTVLTKAAMDVIVATGGEEGLALMARERPDAVVLDLHMPDIDGLEVLQRAANDPSLARIPILMLTGNSDAEKIAQAKSLGARDFVVKPFDYHDLRERVSKLAAERN